MKVLVYGSGVIGCYLAHILCTAGNDVTLLARGQWKEQLQRNGLRIRHHLQRKTTLDHPRVIGSIEEDDTYDAVFAVMPYNRMRTILESLAAVHAPIVVLDEPEALFAVATAKESQPFSRGIENSEKTGNPKKCRVRRECN